MAEARLPDPDGVDERIYIVVALGQGGIDCALSRRVMGPEGPHSGPWGLVTKEEGAQIAAAWNADPGETTSIAHVVEVFRYVGDPGWPETDDDQGPLRYVGRPDGGQAISDGTKEVGQ